MTINKSLLNSKSPMLRGRIAAALEKQFRTPSGIKSFREIVESDKYIRKDAITTPKFQFNRVKFNRMDYKEQAAYEKKLLETKTVYALFTSDDAFLEIPKIVYDVLS